MYIHSMFPCIILLVSGLECTQAAYTKHAAGFMLQNHILESGINARNYLGCATYCNRVLECVSFNWHGVDRVCMINDATKADYPEDYITKSGWSYYDQHYENGHECDDGYCDGHQCEHTCPSDIRLGTPICDVCCDPLGMENGDIPDANIQASEVMIKEGQDFGAHFARLNDENFPWILDPNPWIQVDIGYQTYVSGLITQGDSAASTSRDYITKLKVSTFLDTTDDPQIFIKGENGDVKSFNANIDAETMVTINFLGPVLARVVRIHPEAKSADYWQIRFEVLGCKAVWIINGDFSYHFAHTSKGTFSQAETDCQSKGAFLASIHSAEEQDFMAANVQDDGSHSDFGYWIGFQDRDIEGTFEWVDDTLTNYVNWQAGQPNNHGGQDCTSMWARKAWKWTDLKCTDTYLAHVCKKLRI